MIAPGLLRDTVIDAVAAAGGEATLADIRRFVIKRLGPNVPDSSIRSSAQLQLDRVGRGLYRLKTVIV